MKITILQGAFLPVPPILGGAVEKRWFAMGKEFARKGHEVEQISRLYPGTIPEEQIDAVLHKRVPGYDTPTSGLYLKWLDLRYTLRAVRSISNNTDIVVTNTFWAPMLLPSGLKTKCMVDVARMPKGQMRFYRQARLRANSSPVAEAIKSELDVSEHKRVVLIPNPLPFHSSQNIDIHTKKPFLLYTGRVHPEKGLELLIEAFKTLNSDWTLKIIGPADVKAGGGGIQYLEYLKKLASGYRVEFVGPVYDMEILNNYYLDASIFIYPSIAEKGETFGLAPLEAMAYGCVPIVSDLTCFKDFIIHDSNGLIFDHRSNNAIELLGKSISSMQHNNIERCKLAKNALEVRQSHSTSIIASLFLEEFNRITEENGHKL